MPDHPTPSGSLRQTSENLVFKFWHLSPMKRFNILSSLDLVSDKTRKLPETQMVMAAFQKAKELGCIDELKAKIREAVNEND